MIRVIIVDDEWPAIRAMQYLLKAYPDIEVVGAFTDPIHLLEEKDALRADILFLDIEMRGTNGLEVAEQLYDSHPDLCIVFVTAYNEYAVSAFELGALDYILKPVSESRINKTIQRIERRISEQAASAKASKPEILVRSFGSLQVSIQTAGHQEPMMLRTAKAEELFALFMHHNGHPLHKDLLIETLWTDVFYENALMQLHTAIYQIRKLLKQLDNGSELRYRHDSYHLILEGYRWDVDEFQILVKEAEAETAEQLIDLVNQANRIYVDHYLEGNGYVWSAEEKGRLAELYNRLLMQAVAYFTAIKQDKEAVPYLRLLIQHNPLHEGYYRQLLSIYAQLHDYASVKELYAKLVHSLKQDLGESPHPDTVAHYERLIGRGN